MQKQQSGFTLVELVIVIILLGLLAAAALPRFLDVTAQAQTAAVQGVAGGFSTGVALAKAKWVADGNSPSATAGAAVTLDGGIVYANQNGWPARTSVPNASGGNASFTNQNATECLEVFNFVLQNPPQATTAAAPATGDQYLVDDIPGAPADSCSFTLVVNGAADPDNRNFVYDLDTGKVTTTVP